MNQTQINYADTGCFSNTVLNYISESPNLKPFYEHSPRIESFKELIKQRGAFSKEIRQTLVVELEKQYNNIEISNAVRSNIEALQNENTYTVCTGHQLCLAGGPLYFIYKIASTIKLAKQIEEHYPDVKIVPIFWLATEDHDFEEVNHIHLFNKKIAWEKAAKDAVGRISTEGMDAVIQQITDILGSKAPFAEQASELLQKSYHNHANLADATRYFANALFGEYGLVVLDPDNKALKNFFSPIMYEDITKNNSYNLISETNKSLVKEGAAVQVNPREINFFYLNNGSRERLVKEGDNYKVLNTEIVFTKDELGDEMCRYTERFSPNVLMRPLYQETVLPNLAYIGGGAEVNYWLELKAVFEFYKTGFPMVLLRNSALIVDETSAKRFQNLGFNLERDIFKDIKELTNSFVASQTSNELSLAQEIAEFDSVFESLAKKTNAIDASLMGSLEAEKTKFYNSLKGFESKLIKAEKKKFEQQLQQIQTVKDKLFPNGVLQERYDNFLPYYVKEGQNWITMLIDSFDPLGNKFTIFY